MNAPFVQNQLRSVRPFAAFVACFVAGVCARAQGQDASGEEAAFQPFVSETTIFVLRVDSKRIELPDLAEQLKSQPAEIQKAYNDAAAQAAAGLDWLRAATKGQPLYATINIPHSKSSWPAFFFLKTRADLTTEELLANLPDAQPSQAMVLGDWTVVSPIPKSNVARLLELSPASPRSELAGAFAAVDDYPVQLLLLPPTYLRATVRDLLPNLPQALGGGPSELLTEGLSWAALGVDPARLRVELIVQSASDDAARELSDYLPTMLKSLCLAAPELNKRISPEMIEALLGVVKPQVSGNRFTVQLDGIEQSGAILKVLASVAGVLNDEMRRRTDSDRFHQIVVAMHNYHDVHGTFPPGKELRDSGGAGKLSWRVHILPYMEQVPLYQEFHLDEPWDSPHNKPLIEKMPDVFKSRSLDPDMSESIKPGYTTFLAPAGEGAVFGGEKAVKFQDIRDGTSNTVVLVDVKPESAVPWTAPDDYSFDPQSPGKGLRIGNDGRFLAATADSAVHPLRGDMAAETLLGLFRMNDRTPIDWQAIR